MSRLRKQLRAAGREARKAVRSERDDRGVEQWQSAPTKRPVNVRVTGRRRQNRAAKRARRAAR